MVKNPHLEKNVAISPQHRGVPPNNRSHGIIGGQASAHRVVHWTLYRKYMVILPHKTWGYLQYSMPTPGHVGTLARGP